MNLTNFLIPRVLEAVQPVLRETGDVETRMAEALAALLSAPDVALRIRRAGPQERRKVDGEIVRILQELRDRNAAPTSLLVPKQPPLLNPTPSEMRDVLREAAGTVIAAADDAIRRVAKKIDSNAVPPKQDELAAWIGSGGCPAAILGGVAKRLAALLRIEPDKARVTGWALGGLTMWRDGLEFHCPAADIRVAARKARAANPLAPLVRAWLNRPRLIEGDPTAYGGGFLDTRLAVVNSENRRAGWPSLPFSLAGHFPKGQDTTALLVLPGLEAGGARPVQLPPELLALAQDGEGDRRGGAALKMRLWLAGAYYTPPDLWRDGGQYDVSARQMLGLLYPGKDGYPRAGRWQPRLLEASEALDALWMPYVDPKSGKTGAFRPMLFHRIPPDPDESIRVSVDFGPGGGKGPPIDPDIFHYATSSRRAFYALLQLTVEWWQPGLTRVPVGHRKRGLWAQLTDTYKHAVLDRYGPPFDRNGVIDLTAPFCTRKNRRDAFADGMATLRDLESKGKVQIIDASRSEWFFVPARLALPDGAKRP